jgi:hypothetical protein
MEKNRAPCPGHWRIGIMPDLNKPVIGEIAGAHFFVRVIVGRILGIDYDMTIIIWRLRIITPNVRFCHLMVRIVGSGRQLRVVSENLPDLKYSGRRSSISLFFPETGLILSSKARSPGNSIFPKQHW